MKTKTKTQAHSLAKYVNTHSFIFGITEIDRTDGHLKSKQKTRIHNNLGIIRSVTDENYKPCTKLMRETIITSLSAQPWVISIE